MSMWHIVEGVLIALLLKFILHIVDVAKGIPKEKFLPSCIRVIEISMIPLLFWGDNRGWSFAVRYTLLCICMFGAMIRFLIDKNPLTRDSVFWGIAIPLFGLIIGAMDFKIHITLQH